MLENKLLKANKCNLLLNRKVHLLAQKLSFARACPLLTLNSLENDPAMEQLKLGPLPKSVFEMVFEDDDLSEAENKSGQDENHEDKDDKEEHSRMDEIRKANSNVIDRLVNLKVSLRSENENEKTFEDKDDDDSDFWSPEFIAEEEKWRKDQSIRKANLASTFRDKVNVTRALNSDKNQLIRRTKKIGFS